MIPGITAQASTSASLYTPADFMAVAPTALFSLRKLNPAYSGDCIKVRRSTDNTTLDVGFVGGELDTISLLAFVGAGNAGVTALASSDRNGDTLAIALIRVDNP